MIITDYISIRTVLDDLQDSLDSQYWNEMAVLENAAKAMEKLAVKTQVENKIFFTKVTNHKAVLPQGIYQLNMIAYKVNNTLDETDIEEIKREVGINNDNYYEGFTTSSYFRNNYWPMRYNTSEFGHQYMCEDCKNIDTPGEHSFTIEPNGCITTSLQNGYICISYLRYPVNEEGDFLIPNNPDVIEAIKSYCLMRIFEKRFNMKEEGVGLILQYWSTKWNHLYPKSVGSLMMPSLDEYENIKNMTNRLVPVDRRYYSFFQNLNTPEYLSMNGKYYNYLF